MQVSVFILVFSNWVYMPINLNYPCKHREKGREQEKDF